jgi:hypothetical protein
MRRPTVLALTVLLALTACSSPTASVAPTASNGTPRSSSEATFEPSQSTEPSPSTGPSEAPSARPSIGTMQVFPPGAAVEVAVAELNMRRRPDTSARRLETLKRGDVLIVSPIDNIGFGFGPVAADGYTWYPVMKLQVPGPDGQLPPLPTYPILIGTEADAGWVAADDGSRPYLTAMRPRCPTTEDLETVEGMLPAERLACFGDPIVLEGTFGCGGCGGILVGTYKPKWLATPVEYDFLSRDAAERLGPLAVRFPPDGPPKPAIGSIIRVTVHIDDPRSTNCAMTEADDTGDITVKVDPRTAVLFCRERLVVDTYEVIGTDPDFPG